MFHGRSVFIVKGSFTIFKVGGIRIQLHVTFLILLAWIGIGLWIGKGGETALRGLIFVSALFGCVLLHELGHAAAARMFGIRTPRITLLPFGGLAEIERIPKQPFQEIVIAVAGPLVNVLIAAGLWLSIGSWPDWEAAARMEEPLPLHFQLLAVNVMLVLFNMIPAFPMDGGRVLRAFISIFRPWEEATQTAARVGQVLDVVSGLVALSAAQPFLLLIAVFIFFAAGAEARSAQTEGLLEGVTAWQAAQTEFHTVRPDDSLETVIQHLIRSSQEDYPVVNETGRCVGVLARRDLMQALAKEGPRGAVESAMRRDFPELDQSILAVEALRDLQKQGLSAAPVASEDGPLLRWFTTENVTDFLLTQSALAQYVPDRRLMPPKLPETTT